MSERELRLSGRVEALRHDCRCATLHVERRSIPSRSHGSTASVMQRDQLAHVSRCSRLPNGRARNRRGRRLARRVGPGRRRRCGGAGTSACRALLDGLEAVVAAGAALGAEAQLPTGSATSSTTHEQVVRRRPERAAHVRHERAASGSCTSAASRAARSRARRTDGRWATFASPSLRQPSKRQRRRGGRGATSRRCGACARTPSPGCRGRG